MRRSGSAASGRRPAPARKETWIPGRGSLAANPLDVGRTPSYNCLDVSRSTGCGLRFSTHRLNKATITMAMTHPVSDGLEYNERADEDLVAIAKSGDNLAMEYLLNKYKNFVRIKAKSYFLIGADREDIIQEGMIGLYKAVRDFKADKLSSFRAFAELCITRQIITAIKTATRQKHIPLNQYISLNKPIYDEDSERTLLDVMASQKTSDPEELVVTQEVSDDIRQRIRQNLSELESQVLESYLEGKSYQEMARDLGRHVKSIDNALQRVKRKIEKNLAEFEFQ
jgi:RNA polymerase sporulation-specific sigma factor